MIQKAREKRLWLKVSQNMHSAKPDSPTPMILGRQEVLVVSAVEFEQTRDDTGIVFHFVDMPHIKSIAGAGIVGRCRRAAAP